MTRHVDQNKLFSCPMSLILAVYDPYQVGCFMTLAQSCYFLSKHNRENYKKKTKKA